MELLKKLCETPGIPGYEERIREVIREELKPFVDEIRTDRLGNLVAHKKSDSKLKVMISAHMDEIGFVVTHIDKKGFLRFSPVGGFDPRTLVAQRVMIHGKKDIKGVIGAKPVHIQEPEERKKGAKLKELFIDVGLSEKEVKEMVKLGDSVTLDREFVELSKNLISSKAFDDRIGIFVMIEAMKKLKSPKADVYAVASVQEEVGLRGAVVSSYGIEPEIGVAIDVTIAADVPGTKEEEVITRVGKGTAIKIMDSYSISDAKLVEFLKGLAEEREIPYQLEILPRGGTDAAAMQKSRGGARVVTISVPTRYVHSVVETASKDDVTNSIRLLVAFLENLHRLKI
ncbi:MAG: M42 family metallopeptidase [Candidatus Methanofastidiosia archaeon]